MSQVMIDTTDPERAEACLAAAYGGSMRTSVGEFAVLYRQTYGPPPSRTLRS